MRKFKLENVKKGDTLIYNGEECIVVFKFRKEIPRDFYKTKRPVFRVEFEDGSRMNLSIKNEKQFSFSEDESTDIEESDSFFEDSRRDLAHYRRIASEME